MTHVPVLLNEVIKVLDPRPGNFVIDGTVGEGGHAKEIIKKIEPGGMFLGIDWDEEQVEKAKKNIFVDSGHSDIRVGLQTKVVIAKGNYKDIPEVLQQRTKNIGQRRRADGLLLDLGFSSRHLESGRGFSFQKNEPLDMRYSNIGISDIPRISDIQNIETAADIVNTLSEEKLADIFWQYGEERASKQIANAIVEARKKEKILTTGQLVKIIEKTKCHSHRHSHRSSIHPATKVFQALRIYVNNELGNLKSILGNIGEIMRPGGRVAIVSFHSLEDRIVKQAFQRLEKEGKAKRINKKVIKPSKEEIQKNPRSRSAKLRAVEILSPES